MLKFFLAVGELLCPSADDVTVQPFARGIKTLETSDAFQPGLEVGVVGLNNVGGIWAIFKTEIVKQVFLPRFGRCYDVLQRPVMATVVVKYVHKAFDNLVFRNFKY